jgi:hypothetical protein
MSSRTISTCALLLTCSHAVLAADSESGSTVFHTRWFPTNEAQQQAFRAWDLFSTPLAVQLVTALVAAPSAQFRAVRFPRLWWCSSNHPNRTEALTLNPGAIRFMAGSFLPQPYPE